MLFDIVTIFPDFFDSPLKMGMIRKAIEKEVLKVKTTDLRNFTSDRHRTTDDRPYGGGEGMIMTPPPLSRAITTLQSVPPEAKVVFFTPRGRVLNQELALELSCQKRIILICGRYEGIDERIQERFCDLEISIGDYVLSGGETAALVLIEVITRLLPGVLGSPCSAERDSFSDGLLEYPQYTRPRIFMDMEVPQVLVSGDHALIAAWRRRRSLETTFERRPDLLGKASLDDSDKEYLRSLGWEGD